MLEKLVLKLCCKLSRVGIKLKTVELKLENAELKYVEIPVPTVETCEPKLVNTLKNAVKPSPIVGKTPLTASNAGCK